MENAGINSNVSTESIHFTQIMETTKIKNPEEYKEKIDESIKHTNFNTNNISDDFVNDMFRRYVERHISIDDQEKVPVCPFETCGECNTSYSDSCYTCEFAKESFQKILDSIYKKTDPRTKARVFCICCGASKRSPLRKWKTNRKTGDAIYICSDCWKIKERIGDEAFAKALNGES